MILDDVELIENLKVSKITSTMVKEKIDEAEIKKVQIEEARSKYNPVAKRGSILYFVIADLPLIDPMYQFSLLYFSRLFNQIIETSEKSDDIDKRVQILLTAITEIIYLNVCRGLFNDHKKIFSFLVSSSIQLKMNEISKPDWAAFTKGLPTTSLAATKGYVQISKDTKITAKQWNLINQLKKNCDVF